MWIFFHRKGASSPEISSWTRFSSSSSFLSSQRDYLWHELTKTSLQPEKKGKKAQGVASTKEIRFEMGFSCLVCVGVFTLQSGNKTGRKREKKEDANKPEPGVFVSECVSADVNRVPL